MAISEFDLIRDYFSHIGPARDDVVLGVGDDCALLRPPPDKLLAVSMDTLVSDRHFLPDADPEGIGHKALAVNLSDLAAMGAEPAWATLALTLPSADPGWLGAFARGFADLAQTHGVQLIGGDTTRGPLSITVQIHGLVAPNEVMRRRGARPGDLVYLSGQIGDAALALQMLLGRVEAQGLATLQSALDRPQPRLSLSRTIRTLASSCIDISDGLMADLGHICHASGVAAHINFDHLPLSPLVTRHVQQHQDWTLPLCGGDDYELCFTLPPTRVDELERAVQPLSIAVRPIGHIAEGEGVHCRLPTGHHLSNLPGHDHFGESA